MSDGEQRRPSPAGGKRPIVYCLIPAELAPKLHDLLREHFRDDPSVEVVVERRRRERRSGHERRGKDCPPPEGERRRIRSATGRRVGERRAALVPIPPAEGPELPRRARRYADRLTFVGRLEPSTHGAEDQDTARLVTRFQAGEQQAFTALYTRYFDRVYGYLRVALRDQHEAEDVTQQVFMEAFEALPRYERRRQPFRAWLFTLVRNSALKQLRKRRRVELAAEEAVNRWGEQPAPEEPGLPPLEWIADRELLLFVERLPLPQRQVLVLRYMLGLTTSEIAQVLERTPETVRMQQSRALAFLRHRLTAVGRAPKGGHQRAPALLMRRQARVVRLRRFSLTSPGPTG